MKKLILFLSLLLVGISYGLAQSDTTKTFKKDDQEDYSLYKTGDVSAGSSAYQEKVSRQRYAQQSDNSDDSEPKTKAGKAVSKVTNNYHVQRINNTFWDAVSTVISLKILSSITPTVR